MRTRQEIEKAFKYGYRTASSGRIGEHVSLEIELLLDIRDCLKEREDVPQENVTDLKVSIYGNGSAGTIPPLPVPSKAGESGGGGGAGAYGDAYHPINVGLKNTRPDESPLSPLPVTTIEENLRDWWYSVQDLLAEKDMCLHERKRVELEKIFKDAQDQRTAEIRDYIEQVIQEERFSGAPFALNKIIAHLKSELDPPIIG